MTSQRQTDANRRNALSSTGPRTEEGKRASRQNAIRHGLTAETVIIGVEDAAEYEAFESEIVTEYDPKSAIERELTRRLASLLWRLRRASLIDTGLLRIAPEHPKNYDDRAHVLTIAPLPAAIIQCLGTPAKHKQPDNRNNGHEDNQQVIARRFLQLADIRGQPLERIGRYETRLWRQFTQTLFALDEAKRHRLVASRHRFTPHAPQW